MAKDILLCNPGTAYSFLPRPVESYPLLGHGYLASYLESNGFSAALFDATFARSRLASLRQAIDEHHPGMVGVYAHISSRRSAFSFAREAHRQGLLAVAGGPDATGYYNEYLKNGFDIVVRGEGEETTRELLEWARAGAEICSLKDIRGLAYSVSGGDSLVTIPRPYIQNIDLLPPPRRDESVYSPYLAAWRKSHGFASLPILGARGCPYSCAFCYRPVFGNVYRKRSPALIVAEIEDCVRRFGARHFRFIDDTFVVDRQWVRELSELVRMKKLNLSFDVLARPELITPDLASDLKAMGVCRVSMGMESGSDKVLSSMHKGLLAEDSRKAVTILRTYGIEFLSWVMLGYPGETAKDVRLTRDLLTEVKPDSTSISFAVPLRGTVFYEQQHLPRQNLHSGFPGKDANRKKKLRLSRLYYRFTRQWILSEIAGAKAKSRGSNVLPYLPLKWAYLAGMTLMSFWDNKIARNIIGT